MQFFGFDLPYIKDNYTLGQMCATQRREPTNQGEPGLEFLQARQ